MSVIALQSYWTTRGMLLVQVGRQEPVMVLRVDKEKGYIDLSKRRVAAEDIQVGFQRCSLSHLHFSSIVLSTKAFSAC